MGDDLFPDPSSDFGARLRRRLRDAPVIWFTTVGADGTPQPNPVWFLWDDDGVLVFNRTDANRLTHVRRRPQVSLNLDGDGQGGDIVVLTGRAQLLVGHPPASQVEAYLAKYEQRMIRVGGSVDAFAAAYPVALRVDVTRVRGF